MIDIVIPTLWRSSRLSSLIKNIHESTNIFHKILFVAEKDDEETLEQLKKLSVEDRTVRFVVNDRTKSCLGAFNAAVPHIKAPYWFAGGDDLFFHNEWAEKCLEKMCSPIMVVGTDDLLNNEVKEGQTATHFLVDTKFNELGGTFDEKPGEVAYEGYGHDFFDTELVDVAKYRGMFAPCLEAVVEHLHQLVNKNEMDATYERNIESAKNDREIYNKRYAEWLKKR